MKEENRLIIEQLNKFGRVPQTHELLKMIEQLESNWKELKEWLEDIKNVNTIQGCDVFYKEEIINKMQGLESNKEGNND